MARVAIIAKNEKRKKLANKHRALRVKLRKNARDLTLSDEERFEAQLKLQRLPKDSSDVRVRNRCQLTGRSRGF
jgi:small subunit ribosomal protein S14